MKTRWIHRILALTLVLALSIPFIAFAEEEEAVIADMVDSQIIDEDELELTPSDDTLDETDGNVVITERYDANPYAPTSVYIDRSQGVDFWVGVGSTQLTPVLTPSTARTTLKWKSSNKKVVRVNASGVITPIKAGTAKITVTTGNKKKASIKVRIHKNIINKLNPKPTKKQIKSLGRNWYIWIKSVERTAGGKYVASFYLLNNLGKSKRINNLGLQLYIDGTMVAQKYVSKLNVSCGKGQSKVFKVTFSGSNIVDSTPRLLNKLSTSQIAYNLTTNPTLLYRR